LQKISYSFIEPREKRVLSPEVGLVLSFFSVLFIFIIGVILYLSFKIDMFNDLKESYEHQISQIDYQTSIVNEDIERISEGVKTSEILKERNLFFLSAIHNILQLVPDKITLSKIDMREDELIIYGKTPTKDIYNLLMLAPLKSIFDKSFTSFYLLDNGWYKFVSYNSMDDNLTIFRDR
jgi:hypothetical protein